MLAILAVAILVVLILVLVAIYRDEIRYTLIACVGLLVMLVASVASPLQFDGDVDFKLDAGFLELSSKNAKFGAPWWVTIFAMLIVGGIIVLIIYYHPRRNAIHVDKSKSTD